MRTALVVGINEYAGSPESTLHGCVQDARDWSDVLFARGFQVTILTDHNATRKEILSNLKDRTSELKKDDVFVFTNSSHGTWSVDLDADELDRRDECICPHDVAQNGPISDDEMFETFVSRVSGSRIVVLSDSCFSGTMARFAPALSPASVRVAKIRYMPPSVWLKPSDAQRVSARSIAAPFKGKPRVGALTLSGCQDDEYSYDAWFGDRPNGAFTYAALKALKELTSRPGPSSSSSSAGPITYSDWHRAIRKMLPSVDYPQTPMLTGTKAQKRWTILE